MSVEDDRIRQLQGSLQLLQTGIDHGSRRVEEMHLAIAKKPFAILRAIPVLNVVASAVETIHDGVTHSVHAAIRSASEVGITTAIKALDLARMDGPPDEEEATIRAAPPKAVAKTARKTATKPAAKRAARKTAGVRKPTPSDQEPG